MILNKPVKIQQAYNNKTIALRGNCFAKDFIDKLYNVLKFDSIFYLDK